MKMNYFLGKGNTVYLTNENCSKIVYEVPISKVDNEDGKKKNPTCQERNWLKMEIAVFVIQGRGRLLLDFLWRNYWHISPTTFLSV